MAAFSNFHFSGSCARSGRAPLASSPRATPHRTTDLAEIAARVGKAASNAALLLWAAIAVSFSLLVMVGFFL
jgi:hypothetical protein